MAETKLSLKLLVDRKANKVLFAEAGKEFVDFLFHILSLPVGTVLKLLVNGIVGSVGSPYKSVESLSSDYFQVNNANKDTVLKPQDVVNGPASDTVYKCAHCSKYLSCDPKTICPACRCTMNIPSTYALIPSKAVNVGTTSNANASYMVMDNLEVKPMSTISGITLMNKLNVKDVSALIEKEVQVGFTEGLAMMKASFEVTNKVLTTVFLSKKKA
ncbi:uncharacterized protein LOC141614711 [Silene latifolia]|uniref:uncharacterized protein LOC141614711 n=1 Tax=Silene latifolia TaxID=37657 RepID=UPI003D784BFE